MDELERKTSERFVVGEPDASGTTLTLREAANRAGVSVSTYRRHLLEGKVTGAHKVAGPDGIEWRIPVASIQPLAKGPRGPKTAGGKRWLEEKAELEAALETERAQHAETKQELVATKGELVTTKGELIEALKALPRAMTVPVAPSEPSKVDALETKLDRLTAVVEGLANRPPEPVKEPERRGLFRRRRGS